MYKIPWQTVKWFVEPQSPCSMHAHGLVKTLYVGRSKYQEIEVLELCNHGKALVLDGKIQSSIRDEWIYHEALVHPAMILHPNPKRVLIIGGGEGATLREVLKHDVEEAVMVDLDEEVIKVAREYLEEWHRGSFDDRRAKLIIMDGREFVEKENDGAYDVVILDIVDPAEGGPALKLYTKEFYEQVKRILKEDGVMVTQATATEYQTGVFAILYNTVKAVFPVVRGYQTFVPSFDSSWGFVIASKREDMDPMKLTAEEVDKRLKERGLELKFYDGVTHVGMFHLPKYLREAMEREKTVATDENPAYTPV